MPPAGRNATRLSRTTLVRVAIAVSFAGVFALAVVRQSVQHPNTHSPAPSASALRVATPETCDAWQREYRELTHDLAACSSDDECVLEARGGVWFELDGCFRTRSNKADMTRADALAERWLSRGCAHDFEVCPPTGRATCRSNHCAELPPPQVPADWTRVDLGRVLSFFVPPDMVRQPAHPEDSIVRVMASPNVSLFADLGEWSDPLKFDRKPTVDSDNPQWALIEEREVTAGGALAKRVAARNVWASWCADAGDACRYGWRYEIGLHISEVPYRGLPTLMLQHPKLTIVVQCDGMADCEVADTIFGSLTFW